MPVSAVDCVQPAIQHTRAQLFTPFRWGQWSRLALVGLLAAELHVGGCNFGNAGSWPRVPHKTQRGFVPSSLFSFPAPFDPSSISSRISEHIAQFLALILVGILVFFVLGFIFLYINSVFRFILFDSVLRRECSIGESWHKWRHAGGRFFLWQLVFQFAGFMFFLVIVGVPVVMALAAGWATDLKEHIGRAFLGVGLFVAAILFFAVIAVVIQALAKDFLVPIMALEDVDFADGWHRLLAMIGPEKGRFAVYLLLKLVLSIAATILFSIISIVPILFVVIPAVVAVIAGKVAGLAWSVTTISLAIILGSVLLAVLVYLIALVCVPGTVFFPAYALYFLASRYPALDAILNPAPLAPAPAAPPIPESPPPFEPPPLPPSPEPI